MKLQSLQSVDGKTRNDVVPYYLNLLLMTDSRTAQGWTEEQRKTEILRVNNLILSKWSKSGLSYIKDKAWRRFEAIKSLEDLKQAVLKS